jgi:hypothetical protein
MSALLMGSCRAKGKSTMMESCEVGLHESVQGFSACLVFVVWMYFLVEHV